MNESSDNTDRRVARPHQNGIIRLPSMPLLAALYVFLLLVSGTTWIWSNATHEVTRVADQAFDYQVKEMRFALRQRLAAYEEMLRGGVGLFAANGSVSRQQWHEYVRTLALERNYPGIQGLGFAQRVLPGELAAHEQTIRAQGFPNYAVTPPGLRPVMTAIIYLEPFDWRNQRAFGYDMFSEPVRREAMMRAADTGLASATGRVTLVQETGSQVQNGFLLYLPVYRKGVALVNAADRRAGLLGYVYAPFRLNDLMANILTRASLAEIGLEIFDGPTPSAAHLLYNSAPDGAAHASQSKRDAAVFRQSVPITFGGRVWTLKFTSSPAFDASVDFQKPRLILGSGIVVSMLMALLVWSFFKSRQQASRLARVNVNLEDEIEGRIRLEDDLKLAKEAAEASNEAKSEFLANVSHELRTPLTLILGPAGQLMAASEPPANWREQLGRLQRNALLLLNRVNGLLDFAKAEAGKFEVRNEAVDLPELIGTLTGDAAVLAQADGTVVDWAVAPELGTAWMDREHLERILLNLIGNALKFTPPGGRIHVAARPIDDGKFLLSVKDTGIGIALDDFSTLFERFVQIDSSSTRRHGGTGIGLALVKQLTELMGGTITVYSTLGEGTEFVLAFPRREPESLEPAGKPVRASETLLHQALRRASLAESVQHHAPQIEHTHGAGHDPDGAAGTVLVAEDSADMREHIRDLLAPDCHVVCVADGEQAWRMLHVRTFDVVVSDVMMPRLDGLSLVERMKGSNGLRHIPIILLTARGSADARVSGLDHGADDYIAKPFAPDELQARVRAAIRMRKIQAELSEASREAGMSLVASGVLHNLGNVLNSVTAGTTLMQEQLEYSSVAKLKNVVDLLREHSADLAAFFASDSRAALLPDYVVELSKQLETEQAALLAEAKVLIDCSEHAREVITSYHHFALPSIGVREVVSAGSVMDAAYTLARAAFSLEALSVERAYDSRASLVVDRHKLLQILINLIGNALRAMRDNAGQHRLLLKTSYENARVHMSVVDNGNGIDAAHLLVLFNQRFTTRADGNGIGLHSSAIWARELGGELTAHSDGLGCGATFMLDLPGVQSNGVNSGASVEPEQAQV